MCLSDRITGGRARLLDLEALDALRLVDRERGRPVLTAADVADEHARPLSWRALGRARPRLQATKRITGAIRLHHGREDGRACCCGVVDFCVLLPLVPCGSADGVPLPLAWQHPTTGLRCGNIPSSAPPILPTHYPHRTRSPLGAEIVCERKSRSRAGGREQRQAATHGSLYDGGEIGFGHRRCDGSRHLRWLAGAHLVEALRLVDGDRSAADAVRFGRFPWGRCFGHGLEPTSVRIGAIGGFSGGQ
jgi:hypothetical protein